MMSGPFAPSQMRSEPNASVARLPATRWKPTGPALPRISPIAAPITVHTHPGHRSGDATRSAPRSSTGTPTYDVGQASALAFSASNSASEMVPASCRAFARAISSAGDPAPAATDRM
jgi:hypothetical protein